MTNIAMQYETIQVERVPNEGGLDIAVITLNRPRQLNALSDGLMDEVGHAVLAADASPQVGCIIIAGSERAFAAGADVTGMRDQTYPQNTLDNRFTNWDTLRQVRKPVIAAVAGIALGGGCELAMMCDIIIAADTARFGQPEIRLAVIPGAGGTQRLPRAVGLAKAMDLVLTGRTMDAAEAERSGLVSRVVPAERCLPEALEAARQICRLSLPSLLAAKETLRRSQEAPLSEGLLFERRAFQALFATADQKEGMAAFVEKRAPVFQQR